MVTLLHQLPVAQNMNFVYADNRTESVGTVNYSFTFHDFVEPLSHLLLSPTVEVARGFVKHVDLGTFFEEASSNQHSLALSAGQLGTQVSNLRVIAVGHGHDFVVEMAFLSNFLNFLLGRIQISVFKIKTDSVIKQHSILGNHRNVFSERLKLAVFDVLAVNQDSTIVRIVHSEKHMQDCRFAEARWADDCICGPRLNIYA